MKIFLEKRNMLMTAGFQILPSGIRHKTAAVVSPQRGPKGKTPHQKKEKTATTKNVIHETVIPHHPPGRTGPGG
jgi:hypothetical protein